MITFVYACVEWIFYTWKKNTKECARWKWFLPEAPLIGAFLMRKTNQPKQNQTRMWTLGNNNHHILKKQNKWTNIVSGNVGPSVYIYINDFLRLNLPALLQQDGKSKIKLLRNATALLSLYYDRQENTRNCERVLVYT